jgi:hypothetical protein
VVERPGREDSRWHLSVSEVKRDGAIPALQHKDLRRRRGESSTAVGIEPGYGLENRGIFVRDPVSVRCLFPFCRPDQF